MKKQKNSLNNIQMAEEEEKLKIAEAGLKTATGKLDEAVKELDATIAEAKE